MENNQSDPKLAREMGFWALVLYGVGDMLGSGIYALIGKVAGIVGNAVWLTFLVSMLAALFTALSYASLGSRYPRAAGETFITQRAFRLPWLSYLVGLTVVASGLTSMAVQAIAFSGYFTGLLPIMALTGVMIAFMVVLTLINFIGIRQSSRFNIVCTLVEVTGLLLIILAGIPYWGSVDYLDFSPGPQASSDLTTVFILQGAVLAFYSFIGIEDMINVTEEVKDPRRVFPRAVLVAIGIVTVLYIGVGLSAVSVVSPLQLADSREPLVDVISAALPVFPAAILSIIALFAIANTGLINFIMGSRLVYGMARQGLLPAFLGRVHHTRRTPHLAILTLALLVSGLMFIGNISDLASATSLLLLAVFIAINIAQIALQRRPGEFDKPTLRLPIFVPVAGALICAVLIGVRLSADTSFSPLLIAGLLLVFILLLYGLTRPKISPDDIQGY